MDRTENSDSTTKHPLRSTIESTYIKQSSKGAAGGTVRYLWVDCFSESEASRQLAAICKLLLLALARDFNIKSMGTVTIAPSEKTGVKLRISERD